MSVPRDRTLLSMAKEQFGVRAFRPGQLELMRHVLRGRNALGVLPTGSGKSLCFQLPSLFLDKPVLVISPLLALMHDQKEKLDEAGIEAAKLDSTLRASEEHEVIRQIGKGSAEIVYLTPERLENPKSLELLKRAGVSLFVIDEAHCVSQWGHDFRPSYLALREAIRALGKPPVLALTATATPQVREDILQQLDIEGAEVVELGVERKNLKLEVLRTVNRERKLEALEKVLSETEGAGIVYVATIKEAEELEGWLKSRGLQALKYHGKMKAAEREAAQSAFMENRCRAVVATKAFGLGVDKPDVRFVVHFHFPDSIESYYQEVGRAGRDKKPARGVLLYRLEDRRIQSYFLGGKYPSREESYRVYHALEASEGKKLTQKELSELAGIALKRVKVIVAQLEAMGVVRRGRKVRLTRELGTTEEFQAFLSSYEERRHQDRERLSAIMHYGQTTHCRMRFIREYFGEKVRVDCGRCDNCRMPQIRAPLPPRVAA